MFPHLTTHCLIISLLVFCSPVSKIQAQNIDVESNHPVYNFIDYLETRGLTNAVISTTKPLSRREISRLLKNVLNSKKSVLNSRELKLVTAFRAEFIDFSHVQAVVSKPYPVKLQTILKTAHLSHTVIFKDYRFLFLKIDRDYSIAANPLFAYSAGESVLDLPGKVNLVKRSGGLQLQGTIGRRMSYFVDFRDTRESGNKYFPVGHRLAWPGYGYAEGRGDQLFHDEAVAFINVDFRKLTVQLGKNSNRWGPALSGGLILNDAATSYNQMRLQAKFGKLRLSYFHAGLQTYPRIVVDSYTSNSVARESFAEKYIAGHRLEFKLHRRLLLALNETVIYGERGLQLAYLNPLMFFRSAEHFYGDRDNVALGVDVKFLLKRNILIYSELLLDDFSWGRSGTSWYGNKQAWLAGFKTTKVVRSIPSMVQFEYVRIRPYVYSHTFPINTYTHYNTSLGNLLQPNSEAFFLNFRFYPRWNTVFDLLLKRTLHGDNPGSRNVGGRIADAFDVHDSHTAKFLDGILESRREIKFTTTISLYLNFDWFVSGLWQSSQKGQSFDANFFTFNTGFRLNFHEKHSRSN